MAYHEIFNNWNQPDPEPSVFTSRDQIIQSLKKKSVCDLLVVGGGIHGACLANLAAFNGLSVVLLEQADFSSGTSSRSTKLIHGGLRYLELLDFKQVFAGIRAREDLFECAEHLVKPERFLIPIEKNKTWDKIKLSLGLRFYDLLNKDKNRKHFWQKDLNSTYLEKAEEFQGAYNYCDGITEDARLVIEHILAAKQEGAKCLNYARVNSIQHNPDSTISVGWTDCLTKEQYTLSTGIVVNCCGPWVAQLGRITPGPLQERIKYSRGSHVIFNRPFQGPCLFLPRPEKARYLFVLPHPAGTLVGTTERDTEQLELEVLPSKDEIEEIYNLLENNYKYLGLTRDLAHYCYAGIRTLPLRNKSKKTSQISRRHIWNFVGGILSLVGGKYTDARLTAFEGLQKVYKLSNVLNTPQSLSGRKLPGAGTLENVSAEFRKLAIEQGVPEKIINQTLARRGALVRYFSHCEKPFTVLADTVLAGEIEFAIRAEQAQTLDDVMRRRCMLEYHSDHGLPALSEISDICQKYIANYSASVEEEKYRQKITRIKALL